MHSIDNITFAAIHFRALRERIRAEDPDIVSGRWPTRSKA
jgi:hypothetical protein